MRRFALALALAHVAGLASLALAPLACSSTSAGPEQELVPDTAGPTDADATGDATRDATGDAAHDTLADGAACETAVEGSACTPGVAACNQGPNPCCDGLWICDSATHRWQQAALGCACIPDDTGAPDAPTGG